MLTISVNGKNAAVSFKSLTREDVVRIALGDAADPAKYEVEWQYGQEKAKLLGSDSQPPRIGLAFVVTEASEAVTEPVLPADAAPAAAPPIPVPAVEAAIPPEAAAGVPESPVATPVATP